MAQIVDMQAYKSRRPEIFIFFDGKSTYGEGRKARAANSLGNNNSKPRKIFLWMNPRSLSTSFEKCVGFMDGAQIWHEPYTSCYFNELFATPKVFELFPQMKLVAAQFVNTQKLIATTPEHPYLNGNLVPVENFTNDWVKQQLEKPIAEGKKFMFIKDSGMGIDRNYDKLPEIEAQHTFIIRHPRRLTLSGMRGLMHLYEYKGAQEDFELSNTHPFMSWERLSADPIYKLWNYLREKGIEPNPIVIDADDLQTHPEQILRKYCEAVGIPFKKEYLKWDRSDESIKDFYGAIEQMVWGKQYHIYDTAFLSEEFMPLKGAIPESVPDKCLGYMREFEEGYKVMYETRLKPE